MRLFYFTAVHRKPKSLNTESPAAISIKIPDMINVDQPSCQETDNTRQNCSDCEKSHNTRDKRYTNMVARFHRVSEQKYPSPTRGERPFPPLTGGMKVGGHFSFIFVSLRFVNVYVVKTSFPHFPFP